MSEDIVDSDASQPVSMSLPEGASRYNVLIITPSAAKSYLEGQGATVEWQDGELKHISADSPDGIRMAGEVAQAQIRSRTMMRLGLYVLAGFLCAVAALIIVFAPDGREQISAMIAAALFVVAIGSAGFSTFAFKAPFISASAGREGAHERGPRNTQ